MRWLRRTICRVFGHDWTEHAGIAMHGQKVMQCRRCHGTIAYSVGQSAPAAVAYSAMSDPMTWSSDP
jgi:hypothetical protein